VEDESAGAVIKTAAAPAAAIGGAIYIAAV
jgi:hypothetical protein